MVDTTTTPNADSVHSRSRTPQAAHTSRSRFPLFAFDQTINAERVAAIGAGKHVAGGPDAVGAIPSSLTRVLNDPTYRKGAQAVAADMARLPSVTESVPILQNLAAR